MDMSEGVGRDQGSVAGEGIPLLALGLSGLHLVAPLPPARDPHDVGDPASARGTRDVDDQVDRLTDGAVRNALGDLADQVLEAAEALHGAVGVGVARPPG